MADAPDREFAVFRRGEQRELVLAIYRNALRSQTNPDTGLTFTEEEIAAATAKGSKKWGEADADDILGQVDQQRALWLADQVRVDRSGTSWLRQHHGQQWGEEPLDATGGSGNCAATATAGSVFVGSTTIPDAAAAYATDPAGKRYQVTATVTTPGSGTATLRLAGIDTGSDTNIASGTVLTWAGNQPGGADATFTTSEDFTGGTDDETDAEFARRLMARIRHKPAAGNPSHFRSWAREASNSVEDAFVYPCAQHAGSVIVVVTQKRANTTGPEARIPNLTTLDAVRAYIVPPASDVVPAQANVLVLPPVAEPSDVLMTLAMVKGRTAGWADYEPWPVYHTTVSSVTHVSSQTSIRIHCDDPLPSGVTAPALMVWNEDESAFESLNVTSVTSFGGNEYTVTLSQSASFTIAVGDYVSPDTEQRDAIAEAAQTYFDERGPGEVVDLDADPRGHRAFRFPEPYEEWPQLAGSSISTTMQDALGVALASADLISMSGTSPTLPTDPIVGPSMLTLGKLAVYAG